MASRTRENKAALFAWLEKNATLVLEAGGRRIYEIEGRQQPFTAVDPDGYVVGFFSEWVGAAAG